MSYSQKIYIFLITFVVFLVFDAIWLTKVSPKMYKQNIGHLMAEKPNLWAALLFYLIYIIGLVVFVVVPAINNKSISDAAIYGALFGLVAYSTFDLTSQAVFKGWPIKITVIDLFWGTSVTALVTTVVYWISTKFVI